MAANIQFSATERPPVAKHDSAVLDLAFVMDCTSSMGAYIRQAQQNIRQIVENIVAKEVSNIHLALVEYRDHPPQDSSFVTRVHDFTPSVKTMKGWLDNTSAQGGGDGPEAVADAWHALLKLDWRSEATKICVHIADAPPHGLGNMSDGFPNGCPDGLDPVETMHQLAGKGVTLYMVGCEPSINRSKPFYQAMAHLTGGQYVPLTNAALLTQVIIGGAEEELCLEALMAEVEEDLQQQRAQGGGTVDDVAFSHFVQTKLNAKGIQTSQLCRNNEALPEAPAYAQAMSKNTTMAQMREAMKAAHVEPSHMGFSFGGAPMMASCGAPAMNSFSFGAAAAPPPAASASLGDSYSVQQAPVNMMQAQRLVQKAKKRSNME